MRYEIHQLLSDGLPWDEFAIHIDGLDHQICQEVLGETNDLEMARALADAHARHVCAVVILDNETKQVNHFFNMTPFFYGR
jgi:hypothetical protein